MPIDIAIIGMAAAAGWITLGESEMTNPSNFRNPYNDQTNIWPLPDYVDSLGRIYHPVVSSGWGSPRQDSQDETVRAHKGSDIMYKRVSTVDKSDQWGNGTANGSKWHFIPEPFRLPSLKRTPVMAIADAMVWSASQSARGFQIVLDHGKPFSTYYQHLVESPILPTSHGLGARMVKQGEIIGYVGGNPLQRPGLKHLHFELWKGGAGDHAIDCEPVLNLWKHHG